MFENLQVLRISGQKLGLQELQQPIIGVVTSCKILSELNFSDCELPGATLVEITSLLKENKALTNLNLSLNSIGGSFDEALNSEKKEENKLIMENFIENMI